MCWNDVFCHLFEMGRMISDRNLLSTGPNQILMTFSHRTVPYNTTHCPRHGYSCLSEYYSALMMLQFGKTLGTKYWLMHFLCKNVLHQSGGGGGKTSSSPSSFFIERVMRLLSLAIGGGVSCVWWCICFGGGAWPMPGMQPMYPTLLKDWGNLVKEAMVSHPVQWMLAR